MKEGNFQYGIPQLKLFHLRKEAEGRNEKRTIPCLKVEELENIWTLSDLIMQKKSF